jgi:hypothetical protein
MASRIFSFPLAAFGTAVKSNQPALNQRKPAQAVGMTVNFPPRPDCGVLSDSIPLFFIGSNRVGLWIAREAEDWRAVSLGKTQGRQISHRAF